MLMKSFIAASLSASDMWNRGLGHSHQVPEEAAVRLPNVIFGSLTAVVIFLLAQELFGVQIGLLSALLWSIGTIAIMINRVAKEDTLLVCFAWLAYYLYLRGQTIERRTWSDRRSITPQVARALGSCWPPSTFLITWA